MGAFNTISILLFIISVGSIFLSIFLIFFRKTRTIAVRTMKYSTFLAVIFFILSGVTGDKLKNSTNDSSTLKKLDQVSLDVKKIGRAKICIDFENYNKLEYFEIPASTIFIPDFVSEYKVGSIITLNKSIIKKEFECSIVDIKIFSGKGYQYNPTDSSKKIIYQINDFLEYPEYESSIKLAELVDNASIHATIIEDATDFVQGPPTLDKVNSPERCKQGALGLSNYIGSNLVRQTSSMVELQPISGASFISYSCGKFFTIDPDVNIFWNYRSKPLISTVNIIGKAGKYLTGISEDVIKSELNMCIVEALKPQNNEMASREFQGVKLDCHAFSRDGGGGSVTLYRRFGRHPDYISNLANIKGEGQETKGQTDKLLDPKECRLDWSKCKNNKDIAENYSRYSEAQVGCKYAANKLDRFGTPEWPWLPFGSYSSGSDAPKTGKITLKENDAKFSNQYGAMAHVVVFCIYNLNDNSVIDVQIAPK